MRRTAPLPLCLLIVLLVALAAGGQSLAEPASPAWLWFIEEVDTTTSPLGMEVGLALDSDGRPHLSYHDYGQEVLIYAHRTSDGWQRTVADGAERVGILSAIALDSLDQPHIAYTDSKNNTLKYAHWDGAHWDVHSLGPNEYGWSPSVAVDSKDRPHISYLGYHPEISGGQTPKYAHWNGSRWLIDVIEDVFAGSRTSIALDSRERPHVCYHDDEGLKHAVYRGGRWRVEVVDSKALSGHPVGEDCSLAIDDADDLHISYALYGKEYFYPPWPEDLRYARLRDGAWEYHVPDSQGQLGFRTSLGLDAENRPHISYHDESLNALKHVQWAGAAWMISIVEQPAEIGYTTALAVDQDGSPHIAYFEELGGAVKVARGVLLDHRCLLPWVAK